ncbi:MAG TPA: DNA translocase FtsK 4TM domain-containing protein, partial [Burkholderiaceae bacterium]
MSLAIPKFPAADEAARPVGAKPVWRQRLASLLQLVAWAGVAVALASHRASDPGFTTSGDGSAVLNVLGRPGAWLSDVLLFVFGASAGWLPVVGLLQALRRLARSAHDL